MSIADRFHNSKQVAMQESIAVGNLLPGILDHVVLDKIVTKLVWKDFYILSSVSRAWYNSIRSREVFNSRVLSRSSETLIGYCTRKDISLYSISGNSWYKLPPIPDRSGGRGRIPEWGQCISMDGKIYVVGGLIDSEVSRKVFVLDLAGLGHWEQCASMHQPRTHFAIAVKDGKIYVFGGQAQYHSDLHPELELLSGSEVYKPQEDTWSIIRPMKTCQVYPRFHQYGTQIGEELFILGGWTDHLIGDFTTIKPLHSLEAYHPVKDEWRIVQSSWNAPKYPVIQIFTIHGKNFSLGRDENSYAIHKYDVHGNSWVHVHSFSLAALIPVEYNFMWIDVILDVDDELIVSVSCKMEVKKTRVLYLFQSTGFGSENQKISWKLRATTTYGQERLEVDGMPELDYVPACFVQKL